MGHSININKKNKTIMAKFILEVSDEYIRKQADPKRVAESIDDKASGKDVLSALFDAIAFKHVKAEIDNGTTEFNVSIGDMDDDNGRNIFNSIVSRCAMLCVIKQNFILGQHRPPVFND